MKKITNNSNPHLILIGTGGTGGHVFPAISIANNLITNKHKVEFVIDSRSQHFLLEANIKIKYLIPLKSISELSILRKVISIFIAGYHFIFLFFILLQAKPKLVITFGGFASLPLALAAIFTNTKLIIHEQNSHLGRTNKLFGFFAKLIILSFEKTAGIPKSQIKKTITAPFPIRDSFYAYNKSKQSINNANRAKDYKILIIAGSQGAQSFDREIPEVLASIQKEINMKRVDRKLGSNQAAYKRLAVFHQARKESLSRLVDFYKMNNIQAEVFNYHANIDKLLYQADLVISRSGASCLFEIISFAKPSILIPYPYAANNHQYTNAKFLEDSFAAKLLIYDKNFKTKLSTLISDLMYNRNESKKMISAIQKKYKFDKNKKITQTIEELL